MSGRARHGGRLSLPEAAAPRLEPPGNRARQKRVGAASWRFRSLGQPRAHGRRPVVRRQRWATDPAGPPHSASAARSSDSRGAAGCPAGRLAGVSPPAGRLAGVSPPAGRLAGVSPPAGRLAGVSPPTGRLAGVSPPTGRLAGVTPPTGRLARVSPPTRPAGLTALESGSRRG